MDNFDLRKYLAEGRLFKENYVDPEDGKPFAVHVYIGWVEDEDGNTEKLSDGKRLKTYIQFDPRYYNEEEDDYLSLDDTDDGRYDKIDKLDFWGIWNPDTMKPWDFDGEFDWNGSRTYYFDSEEEISDFGEIFKFEMEEAKERNK